MKNASSIILWLFQEAVRRDVTGLLCPWTLSKPPPTRDNQTLELIQLNNEVLLAVVELLRNDTAVGILHSMKFTERPGSVYNHGQHDGKCVTMVVRP